jgi:hypothetical protein
MKILAVILLLGALALGVGVAANLIDVPEPVQRAADQVLGTPDVPGADHPSQNPAASPSATAIPKLIASVKVTTENGTPRYHVRPTRAGRVAVGDGLDEAWNQAVAKGVPNRSGLRQQFLCHPLSIIARTKSTWDLESWRPTVGLQNTMLSGCNPR